MSAQLGVEYGNREMVLPNEILRSVVGSGLHGIAIEGQDDHDEMGVYIEPPELVFGVRLELKREDRDTFRETYVSRTQPEGARSGPGDTDLVIYSLRKFLRLATKGNPTVLLPLWAPRNQLLIRTALGDELRGIRTAFLSQYAVHRFLAYMHAQHDRMLGYGRRSAVPNRPELIEAHGFDTKYAAHAYRLAVQGYEIARYGCLTLPLPDTDRQRVLEIKRGLVPQEIVSTMITALSGRTNELLDRGTCAVPAMPDLAAINSWAWHAHNEHWRVWA